MDMFYKIYKIEKKGWPFFAFGAHPLNIINLIWRKNINEGREMNFKFNIHPCMEVDPDLDLHQNEVIRNTALSESTER